MNNRYDYFSNEANKSQILSNPQNININNNSFYKNNIKHNLNYYTSNSNINNISSNNNRYENYNNNNYVNNFSNINNKN